MKCPDCKDGYYYPLLGPREVCQGKQSREQDFFNSELGIFNTEQDSWHLYRRNHGQT